MSTPRLISVAGLIVAAALPALAQQPAAPPRPVAAPPATVGIAEEPLPPSPMAEAGHSAAIGRPATAAEIAAVDIDILPDGRGLPEGTGSFEQGAAVYAEKCAACHGDALEGIKATGAPALIGGRGSLAGAKPVKTVESYWPHASTLFDYMHRAMPMPEPGSLAPDELYALSAFILGRGGIVGPDAVMDRAALSAVVMPNAGGFITDPRPDVQ